MIKKTKKMKIKTVKTRILYREMMDMKIEKAGNEVFTQAEVGDIIYANKDGRGTHFLIVSKVRKVGEGCYESDSGVTTVNLEMNKATYSVYGSIYTLLENYILDFDNIKIIKASEFKLTIGN